MWTIEKYLETVERELSEDVNNDELRLRAEMVRRIIEMRNT